MKLFLVVWIGYSCPGGWFSSLIPRKLRPFICEQKFEAILTPNRTEANDTVFKHGIGTSLWELKGSRLTSKSVKWRSEVDIEK